MTAAAAQRIELLWPDGAITSGASWEEVEAAMRAGQWAAYKTRWEFRRALRNRASVWAGYRVRALKPQNSQRFIEQLASAGMFVLVVTDNNEEQS